MDPRGSALVPRPDGASGGARHHLPASRSTAATATALRDARRPARGHHHLPARLWPRRVGREHCAPVGRALAALHLAGTGFRASSGPTRCRSPAGDRCLDGARGRADDVAPGLARELEAELDFVRGQLAGRSADGRHPRRPFSRQRFFLHDRLSGLIDFYFACTTILAYEWRSASTPGVSSPTALQCHQGARPARGLCTVAPAAAEAERAALPVLARGAALRFLLTRLYDWLNTPADGAGQAQGPARISGAAALPSRRALGLGDYGL